MAECETDRSQTTSFQAKLPGGAMLSLATKSPIVLLGIATVAGLVFLALQTWDLRIRVDVLTYSVKEMTRGIREIACLQYIPEAERSSHSGQAAACKKMGEMQ